jgi:hypothetical protein
MAGLPPTNHRADFLRGVLPGQYIQFSLVHDYPSTNVPGTCLSNAKLVSSQGLRSSGLWPDASSSNSGGDPMGFQGQVHLVSFFDFHLIRGPWGCLLLGSRTVARAQLPPRLLAMPLGLRNLVATLCNIFQSCTLSCRHPLHSGPGALSCTRAWISRSIRLQEILT